MSHFEKAKIMIIQLATALISGIIFGIGLIVSGMFNPAKVLGFLDIAGQWNPSLIFVMAGAISIGFFAFRMAKKRGKTWLATPLYLPDNNVIDARLILGSILFGVGWGVAGICPGPALVLAGSGYTEGIIFVMAMLAGMAIFEQLEKRRAMRR
jgi:uncharacterized membrane protein YedE/YeeE